MTLTIRNSALSGNTATNSGGGLYNFDGLTIIESSTIAGNSGPLNTGAGVASAGDTFTRTEVRNSIIAGNTSTDVDFVDGGNTFRATASTSSATAARPVTSPRAAT